VSEGGRERVEGRVSWRRVKGSKVLWKMPDWRMPLVRLGVGEEG
jgi:hypothetical protein